MVGRERAAPPAAEVRLKPIDPWLASSGSYNRSGEGHRVQTGSQIPATSGVSRALQVESNPFSSARYVCRLAQKLKALASFSVV